jgi:FSR family fosmidomycin resistance protein-like MFS transporter
MLAARSLLASPRSYTMPAVGTATAMTALAASHTFVDLVSGSIGALLPTLKHRFDLNSIQAGGLVATIATSTALAQPVVGRIADLVGVRRVAGAGAVLSSALLALIGVAPQVWILFVLILVGGLGSAAYHPAGAVLARRVMPERAQLGMSLLAAGGMVGMALAPIAVLLIVARAGLGFTPLLMIPGVVLGAVLWRFLPGEPRTAPPAQRGVALQLLRGPVGRLASASALAGLAATTFAAGIPIWLTETGGLAHDAAQIGITLAVYQVGAAVGGLAIGWAVSRVAPRRLALASLSLAGPLLLAMLAIDPGSVQFLVAAFAAGVLLNAATPLIVVAAQEHAPESVAAASGIVMGLAGGAAGLAFIAIGAVIDGMGLRAGLSLGFVATLPAALIAYRALTDRTTADSPQLLIGAMCGCLSCSCVTVSERHRCSEACACPTIAATA